MQLKPSDIFYSQNRISSVFGRGDYEGTPIGETLDKLVNGSISVSDIPTITVTKKPDSEKWYTLDNRRLWVFHHLQAKQPHTLITVNVRAYCDLGEFNRNKFTTKNGGCSIRVNNPGGKWCRKIRPVIPNTPMCDEIRVHPNADTITTLRHEPKEIIIDPTATLRKQMIERLRRIQRGESLPIVAFHKWSIESQKRLEDRVAPTVGGRVPLRNVSMQILDDLRRANLESTTERQKAARQSVVEKHRPGLEELEMCDNGSQVVDETTHDDYELHSKVNDVEMTNGNEVMVMLERKLKEASETIIENYKHGLEETSKNDHQAAKMDASIINDDNENLINDMEHVDDHDTKVVRSVDTKDSVYDVQIAVAQS